jgi:hypothetical protein
VAEKLNQKNRENNLRQRGNIDPGPKSKGQSGKCCASHANIENHTKPCDWTGIRKPDIGRAIATKRRNHASLYRRAKRLCCGGGDGKYYPNLHNFLYNYYYQGQALFLKKPKNPLSSIDDDIRPKPELACLAFVKKRRSLGMIFSNKHQ